MTSRKKPGVAFWATTAGVVALLYPLSQGPAGWLLLRFGHSEWAVKAYLDFYVPLMTVQAWLDTNGPKWIDEANSWYLALWN
jgi:hypothetical protein